MRPSDATCPRGGAHEAVAERADEDRHVVCQVCGYVAQGFSNSEGAWSLWNEAPAGGGLIEGTEVRSWAAR